VLDQWSNAGQTLSRRQQALPLSRAGVERGLLRLTGA
jgi:hypothetical protein